MLRSLNQIIIHDAYHMADAYLTQLIQIVAGSKAGSKWMTASACSVCAAVVATR